MTAESGEAAEDEGAPSGIVFDIQHFSLHDGPGIRSTVFLKGCPLACRWCGNPESQRREAQLMYFTHLCAACGDCVKICPRHAMRFAENSVRFDRSRCSACGACVPACLRGARSVSGKSMSVGEIHEEVRRHWRVFLQSGGGVTVSGGEPLAQRDFLTALLIELHDEAGFDTCLDTCAKAPWPVLERVLPQLDRVLLDIKHVDDEKHREWTGSGNSDILFNAQRLAESRIDVLVRIPLIPGFNDADADLCAIAGFLAETGFSRVELMPYHTLGVGKYRALGKTYSLPVSARPRTPEAVGILKNTGIAVEVQGTA
ncbi:MAG: glycyl-radical enzyme activating protein [Candidatus Accumulibacter sp.]|jgi:pyruvate formate lyase activating enzyme|nr:glycyl-radical enzyme activating protein [Accumulibacter sp.]